MEDVRIADTHCLPADTVMTAIDRTVCEIYGYGTLEDVLFYTGKDLGTARDGDYLAAPHPRVTSLITAIDGELGHAHWPGHRMARDAAR